MLKKLRWNLGIVKPFNRDVPTSQKLQGPSGGAGQGQSWLQWQRLCADHVTSSSAELMKLRKLQTCHSPCSKLKAPQRHITVAHKALLMKPFVCHCEEVFLLSTRMFYLLTTCSAEAPFFYLPQKDCWPLASAKWRPLCWTTMLPYSGKVILCKGFINPFSRAAEPALLKWFTFVERWEETLPSFYDDPSSLTWLSLAAFSVGPNVRKSAFA